MDRVLYDWGYVLAGVVGITFAADWLLTHVGAKASVGVADRWAVDGSYEMNPKWQAEVDAGRRFSWRAVAAGLGLVVLIGATRLLIDLAGFHPGTFAFAVGMVLLLQVPILMMHAANLQTFRALADPTAVHGGIRLSRWFAYSLSTGSLVRHAVLWALLWVPSQQAVFLGGALSCLLVANQFRRLGQAARAGLVAPPAA